MEQDLLAADQQFLEGMDLPTPFPAMTQHDPALARVPSMSLALRAHSLKEFSMSEI